MKLLHSLSIADIRDAFYCDQELAKKIKSIAKWYAMETGEHTMLLKLSITPFGDEA